MAYTSTITTKGQVTIPASFRKSLNIKPGDTVFFKKTSNTITISPQIDIISIAGSLSKHAIKGKTLQQIINIEDKALEDAIIEDYLTSVK